MPKAAGQNSAQAPVPPALPQRCLCVGVTGHRDGNAALLAARDDVASVLDGLLASIDAMVQALPVPPGGLAPVRLHTLLADGVDQMAAQAGAGRGWQIVAPLPCGPALYGALAALPMSAADARAMLAGASPADAQAADRAARLQAWLARAHVMALADRDEELTQRLLARLDAPDDVDLAVSLAARLSERVALAGRVMIQQSDLLIAVWDGASEAFVGGTGHTIAAALELGAAVIRIDPAEPHAWTILRSPEALVAPVPPADREAVLAGLVRTAVLGDDDEESGFRAGQAALIDQPWPQRSQLIFHPYRRVEALFGGDGRPFRSLRSHYPTPNEFVAGPGAPVLSAASALPDADPALAPAMAEGVLRRHAFADAVAAQLSDQYRGGMVANFILSGAAVVAGIAYQPIATTADKWMFALTEFALLSAILIITWAGRQRRWHGRWFETRRVAEYLRHAPALLLLGVARPPGRWPRGMATSWPELHARHALRAIGLPHVAITPAYLRGGLELLDRAHVVGQRDYHRAKAERLTHVHHRLDALSARSFQLAFVAAGLYLILALLLGPEAQEKLAKIFTFMGVLLPTFGGTMAGIRFFGDFERFAAISEVTAEKLDALHARISLLLTAPDAALDYGRVAELAHAADEIVVAEIENWQAVFGGKHITVPV
jgi:hypothetical protein